MRLSPTASFVVFCLGFSCADAPEIQTHPAAVAAPVSDETPDRADATPTAGALWSFHGFHGTWAVFAQSAAPGRLAYEEASTVVVNVKTLESARFAGRPVIEPEPADERPYAMQGSPPGISMVNARTGQHGRYLLLERTGRIEVADLVRSAVVNVFEGVATAAEIGADGHALVVHAADGLHVLGIGDARHAMIPTQRPVTSELDWNERGATFYAEEARGFQFFDYRAFRAWSLPTGARVLHQDDDGSMLVLHGQSLELWNLGDSEPRARVAAPALAATHPEEDAFFESMVTDRTLAYSVAVDRGPNQAPTFDFHVTAWDDTDEVVLRGVGECGQTPERLVSVGDEEIKTDVSCSLGCPSEPYAPEYAYYDRRTGALLRREAGKTSPSYNESQAPLSQAFDDDRERLHVAVEDLVILPGKARRYLVARDGALAVVAGKTARTERRLEASANFSVRPAVFSADGAWLSLPRPHGFSVWNVRTGAVAFTVGE